MINKIASLLLVCLIACDAAQIEELETIYPEESMKIEEFLNQVSPLDLKKPELMTAEERTRYVNTAFDRASQGKVIRIPIGSTLTLNPGTYYWTAGGGLTYASPSFGTVWALMNNAPFSLLTPRQITAIGNTDLIYYPERSPRGVPLTAVAPILGAAFLIQMDWGGEWFAIERTAAGGLTRTFTGYGPVSTAYTAPAGSNLTISCNAFL